MADDKDNSKVEHKDDNWKHEKQDKKPDVHAAPKPASPINPAIPLNAERPPAQPPMTDNQQQYINDVMAADPGRRTFARIEGLETAADKRRRSLDVADKIAEKNAAAQADAIAKKAAARQAARDAVDGILKDIDSAINAAIDEGARMIRFPVPMEEDEFHEITDIKIDDLMAALTTLGYNVILHDPRPNPVHFPVAAGDEVVEEDEPKDENDDTPEDEDEDFFGPFLLISW